MPFVRGPNTRIVNPRWRTAAILKKSKKSSYLGTGLIDRHEIWHGDAVRPSWPFGSFQIWNLKIQDGDGRHPGKVQKSRYLGNGLTDRHSIWHNDAHWPSEPDQQLKFRTFKNPRWRTAAIFKKSKSVVLMDVINSLFKTGNKTANMNVTKNAVAHC